MNCGTIAICEECEDREHLYCVGELDGILCKEHSEPMSCKCHCCAHPDKRETIKARNEALGLYKTSVV